MERSAQNGANREPSAWHSIAPATTVTGAQLPRQTKRLTTARTLSQPMINTQPLQTLQQRLCRAVLGAASLPARENYAGREIPAPRLYILEGHFEKCRIFGRLLLLSVGVLG